MEVVIGKRRPRLKVSVECTVLRRQLGGIYGVPSARSVWRNAVLAKVYLHQPLLTRVDMCEPKDKVLPGCAQRQELDGTAVGQAYRRRVDRQQLNRKQKVGQENFINRDVESWTWTCPCYILYQP
jgi:hypothetical protein